MGKEEAPHFLQLGGREVRISHPSKPYFPQLGLTKLDLVNYYVAVADGALRGVAGRPFVLKRFVDGAEGEAFYQKRAPTSRPDWIKTSTLKFPSGRTAEEIVIDDIASLAFVVNLGCIELHPHPVRADDLAHPDELRVDLDPGPGVEWSRVCRVALEVDRVLRELGMQGFPKTSGSRGMHVLVRIERRWTFSEVRRAALALAREIERRVPEDATSKWWKEERHGVFIDYNQNAKDRTTCSAYSIRPLPDARVSAPLGWDEVEACDPARFTTRTMPERFAAFGDRHAGIDAAVCSLERLLELAAQDERAGLADAPWPPHHTLKEGEAPRVAPSRKKSAAKAPREKMPLLVIANARKKDDALASLERWKARYPEAASHLAIDDVLVDSMRGWHTTYTRIRVNLRNVPEAIRPKEEPPDPDEKPSWPRTRGG